MKDILERNDVRNQGELEELLDYLASAIGGLTNPKKLADTFKSVKMFLSIKRRSRHILTILRIHS